MAARKVAHMGREVVPEELHGSAELLHIHAPILVVVELVEHLRQRFLQPRGSWGVRVQLNQGVAAGQQV